MSTKENKAVVLRLAQVLNAGNLDQLDDILAPDYIRHDPNPLLKDVDREEYKEAFTKLREAFPDARWTAEEILADGDKVIGRWSFHGPIRVSSSTSRRAEKRSHTRYLLFTG